MTQTLKANLIAFYTLTRKEVVRVIRIWMQTMVPPVVTSTLYFIIFGHLIGSRVGVVSGFDYMSFIVPGLIMMSVIVNAYTNTVSSFFGSKFQKNIEELLVSPMNIHAILWGFIVGGVLRGLIVGFLIYGISLVFVTLPFPHPWVTFLIALLTSILFAIGGILNGLYATKFDDISIIPTFVLTPLIYLGGVFYSVDMLPEFWQKISHFNPIFYMINGFRYGMLGVSDIHMDFVFTVILIFISIFYALAAVLLKLGKGLRS